MSFGKRSAKEMKIGKVILGIIIFSIALYPVKVFANGTLSGIGMLVTEEKSNEPDIYQVTLPTDSDLKIILDPEGLLSISEQGSYDSSWAGKIHMAEGKGAVFVNRSSFPVLVKVGISIGQDTRGTPSTISLLENEEYVDKGVWPQMYLTVVPGATKIEVINDFEPSDISIPILANGVPQLTTFSFLLDSSEYIQDKESSEYVLAEDEDNYDSASFILGGRVNKNADWSEYIGTNKEHLTIHAVYTIQKQSFYDEQCFYQIDGEKKVPHALIKETDV